MHMFGFVSRNLSLGLVYGGKIESIDKMCDSSDAQSRWKETSSVVTKDKREKATIQVYGQSHEFTIPIYYDFDDTREDVTKDVIEYVSYRATLKYIPDMVLGLWTEISRSFSLLRKGSAVVFKRLQEDERNIVKDQGALVMMKEYIDGYIMKQQYDIQGKTMNLNQDYELQHPTRPGEIIHIKDNYTAALRYNIFCQLQQYAMGEIESEAPLLFDRQYDVIKRLGRRTVFVCPRRKGKTVLLAFLALRAMLKETKAKNFRPTSVLFIGLNNTSLGQAIHYLKKMQESFGKNGSEWRDIFHFDPAKNVFSFRKGKEILGTITFLTAEGSDPGVGLAGDCVIIDEGFKIKRSVREGIEPIVWNEGADLICASTMYYDAPKDWFYELLVQFESKYNRNNDIDADIIERWDKKVKDRNFIPTHDCGLRYTIDDPAAMTPEMVEAEKKRMSKNPIRYFAELYSRVPDEGKVFRYEDSLQPLEVMSKHSYQYIVLAYDPALSNDKSAVVVLGYSLIIGRVCILEEQTLNTDNKTSYDNQVQQIKNLRNAMIVKYQMPPTNVLLVMDSTGAQKAIADLLSINGVDVDMKIMYGSGDNVTTTRVHGEFRVPKKQLVAVTRLLMETGRLQIGGRLRNLLKQLDNFYQIDIDKFGGVGENDDHVNAMMMGIFMLHEYMGLKYTLLKEGTQEETKPGLTYDDIRQIRIETDNKVKMAEIGTANEEYFRKFVY